MRKEPTKEELLEQAKAESLGYDHRDLNWGAIGQSIFWFFILTGVFYGLSFLAMVGIQQTITQMDRPITRPFMNAPEHPPAKSPVQSGLAARRDMETLRAQEKQATTTYREVDPTKDIVAVPVERAIEMMAEKGPEALKGARSNQ